ncbi:MAG: ATP-grasp domain-containing protein, partial [Oscillospiraceae bacterium]|nr:ATP-grasp domain-containing protein [Oscillospiraceae bacterium]
CMRLIAAGRGTRSSLMADVKNILVFPAGTEIAFEIHDALKNSKFVRLFGATSVPCHAEFVFQTCVTGLPFVDDPALIPALNRVIDAYGIDYVYPAHDSALLRFSEERDALHAKVVASARETVGICRSKTRTYRFLRGAPYLPAFYGSPDEIPGYPVFIKPAVGQGSQGARIIRDRSHLEEALSEGQEYTICEYLPGEELTVDCFTDRHGSLLVVSPRSRERIRAGIAVRSRNLPLTEDLQSIAEDINRRLSFNGAWFFQVKKNAAGQFRLLEIAPRIAGTMGLTRNLGINMPLLTLYNFWGIDVSLIPNREDLLLDRAFISRFQTDLSYSSVYVDFDDTLIVRGKVNAFLMMFLYQAFNQGKRLCLLTRHSTDIFADLEKACIPSSLFSEIIRLDEAGAKTDYIAPDSIFIDDSFSERKRVRDALGIPVFDLDMVESLIDWRS